MHRGCNLDIVLVKHEAISLRWRCVHSRLLRWIYMHGLIYLRLSLLHTRAYIENDSGKVKEYVWQLDKDWSATAVE